MKSPTSASPGTAPAAPAQPSFFTMLAQLFKSPPAPIAPELVAPMPLPPAPKVPSAPRVLHFEKGQGTILRRALKPEAPVAGAPAPIVVAEMPSHGSVLPEIILVPAVKFLQASRTVLSAFRKAPPVRLVTPEAGAEAAQQPPSSSRRFAPETRFANGDYPIV